MSETKYKLLDENRLKVLEKLVPSHNHGGSLS